MDNTLIIYEGKYGIAKRTADSLGYLIGNTKVCPVIEVVNDLLKYDNVVLVFSFYGPFTGAKTKTYLKTHKESLKDRRIGLIGVGLSDFDFMPQIKDITGIIGKPVDYTYFVEGELRINKISKEDLEALERFKKVTGMEVIDRGNFDINQVIATANTLRPILKSCAVPMEKKKLWGEIQKYIEKHNTLALATANGEIPRCSPVEYQYINEKFYIITEGGEKFAGILKGNLVSFSIYDNYENMGKVRGMQITGTSEIVPLFSEEYYQVFKGKKIYNEVIGRLPIDLYVISLTPFKFEYLNATFRKQGYDAKQDFILGEN